MCTYIFVRSYTHLFTHVCAFLDPKLATNDYPKLLRAHIKSVNEAVVARQKDAKVKEVSHFSVSTSTCRCACHYFPHLFYCTPADF